MNKTSDVRIPIVMGETDSALPDDFVLDLAGQAAAAGHPPGCACCQPRSALGRSLGALFVARARGTIRPFARVLVTGTDDPETVAAALDADIVARARYRFAGRA
jgi:hypothetical protein